jgi:broad specificity phosphatase PhoE
MRLHLVRHARPLITEGQQASTWPLAPSAADGLAALRTSGRLPVDAPWYSSPEPKALGTAHALATGEVTVVDGLREMERPPSAWLGGEQWHELVARSMLEPDVPALAGWETGRATTERIVAAVRALPPAEEIALAGHGTAFTLLVAALTGAPPDLAGWRRMAMPDHLALEVSAEGGQVATGWHGEWA